MATRSKARKSTSPRVLQNVNGNVSRHQTSRRSVRALIFSSSEDSESEVPTQRLRRRSSQNSSLNTPGPSGMSSRATNSTQNQSDSESDESERASTRRRISRQESTSDTTSDSDVPQHERSQARLNRTPNKRQTKTNSKQPAKSKQQPIAKAKAKQPTKKAKGQRKDSSSDNDEASERSSASSMNRSALSSSSRGGTSMSSLANKCVYYLLICDQKKYAIKRADIIKHVFDNQNQKAFNVVIEQANNVLKQVYGIEIIVHENRKGEFLLINYLDRDLSVQECMELSDSDLQKRGFIFYLLTIIFMNGNFISEDDLCVSLKSLGIDYNARTPHSVFGDVRKYLTTELVKQMYLEYKCISKDPPQYEFSWGVRAKQEVDKKDLLNFACQIMSDTSPEDWILQYKEVQEAAKQKEKSTRK